MSSNGKNNKNNKKYIFKEGSNPLFPISNKLPNYLNYYSQIKINKRKINKNNKLIIINDRNSNLQNKKIIENYSAIKNINKINNSYSLSRPKIDNKQLKITNLSFSKIKNLEFSSSVGDIRNSEKHLNNINNLKINDKKDIEKRINIEINDSFSKDFKNNIKVISPNQKYLGDSIIFNNNKSNIYSLRKPNLQKIEFNNTNYILNDIYSNNNKNNYNYINQLNYVKNYLLTDINNKNKKSSNISNVKIIFNYRNINEKNLNTCDTPILLKRKDSPILLTNTNPGNLKCSFAKMKKNNSKGPEDLHFYFISVIQDGKKKEAEFKD